MPAFDAVGTAKYTRKLLRRGLLTHHEFAVADAMIWSCRGKGRDRAAISYRRVAELARVSRGTAIKAIAKLCQLNIIRKNMRRVLVPWLGGLASRQATNVYEFLATVTGFSESPVNRKQEAIEEGKAVWRRAKRPFGPVRTVAEQLAMLREAA